MKLNFLLISINIIFVISWKPLFVGHRGGFIGVANTVESYTQGVDHYGYDGLECDVRVTKDKKYVISHDESISGSKGSQVVANTNLADLKANVLTQKRGGIVYTGVICTVEEYLSIVKDKNVFPIIELKWTTGINNNDMSNFPGLYSLIEKYGLVDKAIILTSMRKSLEYVRTNYPKLKCQYLMYTINEDRFEWSKKWGCTPSLQTGGLDENNTKKLHDNGMSYAIWCVNTEENYLYYGNLGTDIMTCDYLMPKDMKELKYRWDTSEKKIKKNKNKFLNFYENKERNEELEKRRIEIETNEFRE